MQQAFWAWWSRKTYIPGTDLCASFLRKQTAVKTHIGSVRGDTMKVLLCLCACVAAAAAHGVIGYPVAPLAYHSTYLAPVTTIARPLGVAYHGLPPLPYFSYNVIPNNVVFPGVPGLVHYIPLVPADGKGKPDKKKPGEKDNKDKKEETTEEPKQEEDDKTEEPEDLAH